MREAGGFVTDYRGRSQPICASQVLAANDSLHSKLHKALVGALKTDRSGLAAGARPRLRPAALRGPCGGMVDANDSKSFVARRARSSRARGTSAFANGRLARPRELPVELKLR